jgi:hypothetical protein
METLTGNKDTDETILLMLNLSDVMTICSSNQYFNKLCKNNKLKNKYLEASKQATNFYNNNFYGGNNLYTIYSSDFFSVFSNLMQTLNIPQRAPKNIPDSYASIEIHIFIYCTHQNIIIISFIFIF